MTKKGKIKAVCVVYLVEDPLKFEVKDDVLDNKKETEDVV